MVENNNLQANLAAARIRMESGFAFGDVTNVYVSVGGRKKEKAIWGRKRLLQGSVLSGSPAACSARFCFLTGRVTPS